VPAQKLSVAEPAVSATPAGLTATGSAARQTKHPQRWEPAVNVEASEASLKAEAGTDAFEAVAGTAGDAVAVDRHE
jgi:hypothetical protein